MKGDSFDGLGVEIFRLKTSGLKIGFCLCSQGTLQGPVGLMATETDFSARRSVIVLNTYIKDVFVSSVTHSVVSFYDRIVERLPMFSGLGALALRLYLAPVFMIAGYNKLQLGNESLGMLERLAPNPNVVSWFGNGDWGLGLPAPELLAFMAGWTELLGGFLLIIGLATRVISLPLMFTMIIAATTAHWDNGWFAIAPSNPSSSAAQPLAWLGIDAAQNSLENSVEVGRRLGAMKSLLEEHGNTSWLYGKGNIAVLNNGIEFSVTYFIMLLALFFHGGGRYVSTDYWLRRPPAAQF